jgi:hypothetical protein
MTDLVLWLILGALLMPYIELALPRRWRQTLRRHRSGDA